ncbi:MAG: cytochrome c3 family protein [Planctomycetota bacterium]
MTLGRWLAVFVAGGLLVAGVSGQGPKRPRGPVDRRSCGQCHADVMRHEAVHGPVGVSACDACHAVVSEQTHTYALARPGSALCTFCHDMSLDDAAVVHRPLAKGQCTVCHDPHGGPDRNFLQAPSVPDLCIECHEDVAEPATVHGPVAAGACGACHSPHAAPYPGLLSARGFDLCTTCHRSTKKQLETLREVHEPTAADCQSCHDPHASDHDMMLKAEPQALCLDCHDTIGHTLETASAPHAAVTADRACLNCHDPHASDHPRVLKTDMASLCFECHDREIELETGTTLANIKQVIETGRSLHGPVAQKNCAACHQIHGGDNFRLLIKAYPPQLYAPFKEERYALCFSCHDRQLVHDPRTASLTGFRNGDLNLHFLHVNRQKKGRSCRSCHEAHASSREFHIRESVPFGRGGWILPIRFEKLDAGGRCAPGCHAPYEYNRVEPVTYPTVNGPAPWPAAVGADEQEKTIPGAMP